MAENGSQVKKDDICQKWQEMDFRVFLVVVIEVTRKTIAEMVENGGKLISAVIWQEMDFRAFLVVAIEVEKRRSGKNGKNGRKWSKMGCRGYLVGNGFPRVSRQSPTTGE